MEFLPKTTKFLPSKTTNTKEIVLKVEEIEAMRLKDMENLTQEECAQLMGISRQTFQNIINQGRKKVIEALTEGYKINIKGGNYAYDHCQLKCETCKRTYDIKFVKDKEICPLCESIHVVCKGKNENCIDLCTK